MTEHTVNLLEERFILLTLARRVRQGLRLGALGYEDPKQVRRAEADLVAAAEEVLDIVEGWT